MDVLEYIKQMQEMYGDDVITTADKLKKPPKTVVREIFEDFNARNPKADGGQLVAPSVDGSRPGYAGVYKRKDQRNAWRIMGERGGINAAKWLKSQGLETTYTNKKAADAAYQKFLDANPDKLSDVTKTKWMKEGETLAKKFNTLVQKDFDAGDMSKTPAWETFLKKQKLKHAGVGTYQAQRVNLGAVDISPKKRDLADRLITEASKDLKYKPWMEIQRKLSSSADINTNIWREYIDKHNKINGQSAKVKQAFNYLKNNDVVLNVPKNLSKTMAQEGSLLRKVIFGLTGVNTSGIREGLAGLDEATKSQINFANKSTLWTEGQGRTLTEILDDAAYRMDGNISWSSDIKKLAGRPNKNAFEYALRNFNYYGKRGKVGQIQFYYKGDEGMKNPIQWDEIKFDNKGGKKLKPSKVFFVDSTDPNNTQWTTEKINADHANWKNKKPTIGLLDELYQAKDVYDNLLNTKVTDPRIPKGAKVKFGKIMTDVYGEGYDNFGNPYAIEHGDTVAKSPWKNLRIAEQRINSALYNITRKKGISEGVRKQIINQLNKQTYNVFDKDVITKITEGQKPVIKSVLSEGKKFDQPVLTKMMADLAAEIDPDSCGRKAGATGGRIGFKFGSTTCATKAKNYLNQVVDRGIQNEPSARVGLIKKIISGTGNFIKQSLSPSELFKLENLVGKPALYATAAIESGLLADDVLRKKKPINVAAAENFLVGNLLNLDADAEKAKNIINDPNLSPAAKTYAQGIIDQDNFRKLSQTYATNLVKNPLFIPSGAKAKADTALANLKNKITNTPETGRMDYESLLADKDDYDTAGEYVGEPNAAGFARDSKGELRKVNQFGYAGRGAGFDAPDKPGLPSFTSGQLEKRNVPGEFVIDPSFPLPLQKETLVPSYVSPSYSPKRSEYETDEFINEYLKSIGQEPLRPGEGTLIRMNMPNQSGLFGANQKFAGGGLANLTNTIPPESGPMSQGLRSLYNNGRKL